MYKTKVSQKRDFIYGWVSKYREINFPTTILKILLDDSILFVNNFINILESNGYTASKGSMLNTF
jgi:hypothetical protein